MEEEREDLDKRLVTELDVRCMCVFKGRELIAGIWGKFSAKQMEHLARGWTGLSKGRKLE